MIKSLKFADEGTDSYGLLQLLCRRKEYISKYINLWQDKKIDVMLTPGFPLPAPELDIPTKILRKFNLVTKNIKYVNILSDHFWTYFLALYNRLVN